MLNLRDFMPVSELATLRAMVKESEEKEGIIKIVENIKQLIAKTPELYSTEEQDNPIAMLHYFGGCYDAYITERGPNGEAFGWVSLGYEFEAGYINILELIQNGIELDLYFKPTPIQDLIK